MLLTKIQFQIYIYIGFQTTDYNVMLVRNTSTYTISRCVI